MSCLRLSLTLVMFVSLSVFSVQAQSTTKSNKTNGVISGRVTVRGKGLAGVTVTLRAGGFGAAQTQTAPSATTDADGKYRITDIPIGSYQVIPLAPVYTVPNASRITFASDDVVITGNDTV